MNNLFKKSFFSFFVIFLIVCQPVVIKAIEESVIIKNEQINPGSFYYPFKRLWEKALDKLQFGKQVKINFRESLLKTRLSELNYVVENKFLSEIQQSSERFAYEAGTLTELSIDSKTEDKEKFTKDFKKYSRFLDKLRDKYPANSSFWMLIQHDINTLNILSEKLK